MLLVLNRSASANVLYNKEKNVISIAFYLHLYGMIFSPYKMGNEAEFGP